jgi:hypothetical protein
MPIITANLSPEMPQALNVQVVITKSSRYETYMKLNNHMTKRQRSTFLWYLFIRLSEKGNSFIALLSKPSMQVF